MTLSSVSVPTYRHFTTVFLKTRTQDLVLAASPHAVPHAGHCYRRCSVVCPSVCVLVATVSPAIAAEPMDMPSGEQTRVGPGNHALGGARIFQRDGVMYTHRLDNEHGRNQ